MGRLYDLIQAHIDAQAYPPSPRQVAKMIGVTQTTLTNWRTPKQLIDRSHLEAIARVTGVPYIRVLDALLEDIGYIPAAPNKTPPEADEDDVATGS
jgi:transposase